MGGWVSYENICLLKFYDDLYYVTIIYEEVYDDLYYATMKTYSMPPGDGPSCICHHGLCLCLWFINYDDFNDDFNIVCHHHI